MTFGSLFAGIGGFDLGFERAGLSCSWQVENDLFCIQVLQKHWPDVPRFFDITQLDFELLPLVDVICGGFPCQDISVASPTKAGLRGRRSGLWRYFLDVIRAVQPKFVVIENSSALVRRGLCTILQDLALVGYDAEWQIVRASDFLLPHRRERLFIVAYSNSLHGETRMGVVADGPTEIFGNSPEQRLAVRVQAPDSPARMVDGVRGRAYRDRGHAIGNAVVPAIAEHIGRLLLKNSKVFS